jgi:hypothetical protein
VGARDNLRRWLGLAKPLDYQGVRQILSGCGDYTGLLYFHLLLDRLAKSGDLGQHHAEQHNDAHDKKTSNSRGAARVRRIEHGCQGHMGGGQGASPPVDPFHRQPAPSLCAL